MKKYLEYKLYDAFTSLIFYVCMMVLNIYCTADFLFVHKFFSESGSTNLHLFFQGIPVITAVLLPVLKLNESQSIFDQTIPLECIKKTIVSWLSILIQFFVMLLPLFLLPVCINQFGAVDWHHVFTGFFVLLFYGALSCSLCVLLCSLLQIQAAACLASICILALTVLVDRIFSWNENVIVKAAVDLLSFSRHFSSAEKGIIDTRDIFYYLILSLDFLFLSSLILEIRKGLKLSRKIKRYIFLSAILSLFAALDSSRYYARIDCTKNKKFKVSEYSRKLVQSSEDKIRITYLQSKNLAANFPEVQEITDYLREYSSRSGVFLKVLDAGKLENQKLLEKYSIFARQIPIQGNNKTEYINVYSSIIIEYKDKTEIIPFILSQNSLEYDLDTRILSMLSGKRRIVNVLCGNGMDFHQDYGYVEPWLNSQGFICNEIYLSGDFEKQLSYSNLLVVLGSDHLSMDHCQSIINFIEKSGSVLFAVSPYTADIENDWNLRKSENQNLIEILENYGFHFSGNLIKDLSCARILLQSEHNSDGSPSESTYSQQINYPMWVSVLPQQNSINGMTLYWPAEILESNETDILLSSSPMASIVEPDKFSPLKPFETNPFILENENYSTEGRSYPLELASKNEKIRLIPDQYFVNSLMLGYTGGTYGDYRNLDYLSKTLLELNGEANLAKIFENSSLTGNTGFFKTYSEELFVLAKYKTIFCMFIFVPLLIITAFILQLKSRKRRIENYHA